MGIIRSIKNSFTSQRGSVTILSAIALPVILAFGGMAVDLGNFYSHYSDLQNTAESSALAGGHKYRDALQQNMSREDAIEEAKKMGDYHVEKNMPNNNYTVKYDSRTTTLDDGYTANLLKVTLTERVPYLFLRPLMSILHQPEYVDLSASGYCTMIDIKSSSAGDPMFDDMFLFDGYKDKWSFWNDVALKLTNNVQNPDNDKLAQNRNNLGTYTGAVRAASQTAYEISTASGNIRHDILLSKYAFDYMPDGQLTVSDILAEQERRDRDRYGTLTPDELAQKKLEDWRDNDSNSLTSTISYTGDVDITTYYTDVIVPMQSDTLTKKIVERGSLDSSDINNFINESGTLKAIYVDTDGVDLTLNDPIRGNPSDDPIYIICHNATNTHITGNLASGRPIFLVLTGTGDIDNNGNRNNGGSNIAGGNSTFAGVIYAPYGRVFINDNGMKFDGSIVARGIQTQSNGYYEHTRNYSIGSGSKPQDVRVIFGGADYW